MVSNPWREAIEGTTEAYEETKKWVFPILGGRLLKGNWLFIFKKEILVSNPWREAIEVTKSRHNHGDCGVSNPWREAIEVF